MQTLTFDARPFGGTSHVAFKFVQQYRQILA